MTILQWSINSLKDAKNVFGRNEGIEDDLSKLRKFLRIVGVSEKDIDFSINKGLQCKEPVASSRG